MNNPKERFRHDSVQDAKSIRGILEAVAAGFMDGKLTFKEEDGELVIRPTGKLELRVVANDDNERHSLSIRVSWQAERVPLKTSALAVD